MNEVDIDNTDDVNALAARLYAQIHHEKGESLSDPQGEDGKNAAVIAKQNADTLSSETPESSVSKRYCGSGSRAGQELQLNSKYRIRNQRHSVEADSASTSIKDVIELSVGKEKIHEANVEEINTGNISSWKSIKQRLPTARASNKNKSSQSSLKCFKNAFLRRGENAKVLHKSKANPKQGPFFKQQQTLEKIKCIEQKKQKSKKALGIKQTNADIVDLISSGESDSSDVVMLPMQPPPTFSVDDSDEDEKPTEIIVEHDQNAMDSTDVQMSCSTSSFLKPQKPVAGDKSIKTSSCCNSPCSIQSSDDFIGQNDRSRLLETDNGMADDEDLLLLASDVNSLLEAPHSGRGDNGKRNQTIDITTDTFVCDDSEKLATPMTSASAKRKPDYRVEGQFRATDVYESESDITDSVYSKCTPKTTVIRKTDSSSDEVEDITCANLRTKRLRKRRRSSGNRSSEANNGINNFRSADTHDDVEEQDSNSGTERTGIPFISHGPAVERKLRKSSSRLLSFPQTTAGKSAKSGHMSDGDFIAKLNDLVQGQDIDEVDDSDKLEDAPSARDIVEKILRATELPPVLADIFQTIDNLENNNDPNTISDTEEPSTSIHYRENVVYKSLPGEDSALLMTYVDKASYMKKYANKSSPIYNVVYCRDRKFEGGLGWNDEMRKFYLDTWNGEGFILKNIWRKMNPDRCLWKIRNDDRYIKPNKRQNNLKCTNCCEFGHARYQCKQPMKPLICYMCGQSGHQEPRCPNTICLRCGNKTQVFTKSCNGCSFENRLVCPICQMKGHNLNHCPDKWRRYHSTTEPYKWLNNIVVYNSRKYCSICGHSGHFADGCRKAANFLEYPVSATAIKSHEKAYNDTVVKSPFDAIGYNLMHEPWRRYNFDMSQRTSNHKYYGRFLNAVGLSSLMTRKRSLSPSQKLIKKLKKSIKRKNASDPITIDEDNTPNQVAEVIVIGDEIMECSKEAESSSVEVEEVASTVSDGDIQLNVVNTPTRRNILANTKSSVKGNHLNNSQIIMDSDTNFSEHFDDNHALTSCVNEIPQAVGLSSLMTRKRSLSPSQKLIKKLKKSIKRKNASDPITIDEDNTPNQVAEVIVIGDVIMECSKEAESSSVEVEELASTVSDGDIQLIVVNTPTRRNILANTKSSVKGNHLNNSQIIMDSASDYSFSEHFDDAHALTTCVNEIPQESRTKTQTVKKEKSKSRPMPALPEFIPLTDSTGEGEYVENYHAEPGGISRRYATGESNDETQENENQLCIKGAEYPCEAKIFLSNMHSKYLQSADGRDFFAKAVKMCELKARIDLTSAGHVLVIFGTTDNQDKFQRELMEKYREVSHPMLAKQLRPPPNVPKRTDVLIRFLRDDINQLLGNLGNVNHLYNRLQHFERQETKSGFKFADKLRRSLNMILIGQAGLEEGDIHLQKLIAGLKTLLSDYNGDDVTPLALRLEITDHWKMIFSSHRHNNYQDLVKSYNNLVAKNCMPKLIIDPLLLGPKVLDTSLTDEQREKLEQPKPPNENPSKGVQSKPDVVMPKITKQNKRKQCPSGANNSSMSPVPSGKSQILPSSIADTSIINKASSGNSSATPNNVSKKKKQIQQLAPPLPVIDLEMWSNVGKKIAALLSQRKDNSPIRDSKLPSTFWSRKSMRYLNECLSVAAIRPELFEKIKLVQNKSKNGQLSYNDYLIIVQLYKDVVRK